jgi:hypothetical protein
MMQMTRDDHTGRVLDGREIERSDVATCGLHRARKDEERMLFG